MKAPLELELRCWPLVHGSLILAQNAPLVRQQGLKAPGEERKGLNTFFYDEALGRHKYVFLSPATIAPIYGFDLCVLIDPSVLELEGLRYSLVDIGDVFEQAHLTVHDHPFPYPDWIVAPELFDNIVQAEYEAARSAYVAEMGPSLEWKTVPKKYLIRRLLQSKRFREYLKSYDLDREQFFAMISSYANKLKYSFEDYLNRDRRWPLKEEIMVPEFLSSDYILGFWNQGCWEQWICPRTSEAQASLEQLLFAKSSRRIQVSG
jgi:hypothetical protein